MISYVQPKFKQEDLERRTLDYVYDRVTTLIMQMQNWDTYHANCEFGTAKDIAYREVLRILTDILNK